MPSYTRMSPLYSLQNSIVDVENEDGLPGHPRAVVKGRA